MLPLCISSSGNITQMNIVAQMIKIQNDKKIIIKSLYENCRISLGSVRGYVISDWTNSWRSLISKNQRICNYLVYFGPNRFQLVNLGVTVPRWLSAGVNLEHRVMHCPVLTSDSLRSVLSHAYMSITWTSISLGNSDLENLVICTPEWRREMHPCACVCVCVWPRQHNLKPTTPRLTNRKPVYSVDHRSVRFPISVSALGSKPKRYESVSRWLLGVAISSGGRLCWLTLKAWTPSSAPRSH